MKIFKRWWIRKYNHRKGNDNSHLGYPEAHQAWRAVLEEVLGWLDHSTEHKEIADKIHEELES